MFHPHVFMRGLPTLQTIVYRRLESVRGIRAVLKRILVLSLAFPSMALATFASCSAPQNPIEAENCLPGSPQSEWFVMGAGSSSVQGFATDISVNAGHAINFKVATNATA